MEKFSENPPSRKRGRPPIWTEGVAGIVASSARQFPQVQSPRGQDNARYLTLALMLLAPDDHPDRRRYDWLCPDGALLYVMPLGAAVPQIRPKLKTTILAELGRIARAHGEDCMREIATHLCVTKPTTHDAVRWLRAWRLQQEPRPGTVDGLCAAIDQAIAAYRARYPATGFGEILEALAAMEWLYTAMQEVDEADDV